MTNKSLSEQLCELCGVEAKWIEYSSETTDGCVNYGKRLTYPDFESPENFVKLLQIYYFLTECNLEDMFFDWENLGNGLVEDVLINIIEDLTTHEYDITWEKKLKQTIRDTEWKY